MILALLERLYAGNVQAGERFRTLLSEKGVPRGREGLSPPTAAATNANGWRFTVCIVTVFMVCGGR